MAIDVARLIGASDPKLVRQLIELLAPEQSSKIDWGLQGRALGYRVRDALSGDAKAWPKLQNIESLAFHGGVSTIRSILRPKPRLLDELDELVGGDETAAVWLALQSDELFQTALSALHADRGLNKRSWQAFLVRFTKDVNFSFDSAAQTKFEALVREAIRKCKSFDAPGKLHTHHFQRVVFPDHTHSRRELDQVTVYAEARTVTEEVFVEAQLETRVRKRVDSISVILDRARRELDVVTLGGKEFIREIGAAFCNSFSNHTPSLDPLVRREVIFDLLRRPLPMPLDHQSRFVRATVEEVRVKSPMGLLMTFDARGQRDGQASVYGVASHEFGDHSPFERDGWQVVSARIVLWAAPTSTGRHPRPRAVELKPNGHTNLLEQDDTDRFIADELLTRWGILEPRNSDGDDD